jgi:hypothetical protein
MSTSHPCIECGRASTRLRKDRCNACYMRLYRNGELAGDACCAACGERRKHVLTNSDLGEVLCGNCALVLQRARPRPASLAELVRRVSRERRRTPAPLQPTSPSRRLSDRIHPPPVLDPSID